MKKLKSRFAAVALVTTLGILTAAAWFVSHTPKIENSPCQSCSSLYSSAAIEAGDVCNAPLGSSHPNRMFRVNATFENDAGDTTLGGEECRRAVPAGLASSLRACAGTQKMLVMHSGLGTWYDGAVSVTAVGYYGIIDNPKSYHHGEKGFNIVCLERVQPIDYTLQARVKYVQQRLLFALNLVPDEEEQDNGR